MSTHWRMQGLVLAVSEVAAGVELILGVRSRHAALGAIMLIGPIWVMLWHTSQYVWLYPSKDLSHCCRSPSPPAARYLGYDNRMRARFSDRWPL